MTVWFRLGPFSASSRGRVGVRAGPVGVYGGGRRRPRRSTGRASAERKGSGRVGDAVAGILLTFFAVAGSVEYLPWYGAIPVIAVASIVGLGMFFSAFSLGGEPDEPVASSAAESHAKIELD
jgi:hypothetical protein